MTTENNPTVILRPAPQARDRIFSPKSLARLHQEFRVVDLDGNSSDAALDAELPNAFAVIGQPDLPADRLATATRLRAIVNVEGNFFPNVDYPTAFQQGIRVLGCGSAYGQAVAEYSLGLAFSLASAICREDRAARTGKERYVSDGNSDAILLRRANVGILGYGNIGRSLHAMLAPFHNTVRIYDPWLPAAVLEDAGVTPATLEDTLSKSQFVFVFATATAESTHLLDTAMLARLPDNARLILVSRAAVVDYDALLRELSSGRIFAGVDVWPIEPIPADSPFRTLENVIISGHRAGGIPEAFYSIGDMVCDDLELLKAGLPQSDSNPPPRNLSADTATDQSPEPPVDHDGAERIPAVTPANWTITHARGADIRPLVHDPAGETYPDGQPRPPLLRPRTAQPGDARPGGSASPGRGLDRRRRRLHRCTHQRRALACDTRSSGQSDRPCRSTSRWRHAGHRGPRPVQAVRASGLDPGGRRGDHRGVQSRHAGRPGDRRASEGDREPTRYADLTQEPRFEFGEGLSNPTTVEYTNLQLASDIGQAGETIDATVTLTNAGHRPALETVQAYLVETVTSAHLGHRELKAFVHVTVEPGARIDVDIHLPAAECTIVNALGERVVEPGEFELLVGPSSRPRDLLRKGFRIEMPRPV